MMTNRFQRAGKARWAGLTEQEVSAQQKRIASLPRTDKRCFCGQESMLKAAGRYFDCCRKAGVIILDLKRKRELSDERKNEVG